VTQPPYPSPLPSWPGITHLTQAPVNRTLDLDISIGQRQATYAFSLINGVTGELKGSITPQRPATLSHDTSRTIKRQLSFALGVADSARVQTETDRVLVDMLIGSDIFPLGRYAFSSEQDLTSTGGQRSSDVLLDEMFVIDQQLETGFPKVTDFVQSVPDAVFKLLTGLPLLGIDIEPSTFPMVGSWNPGTTRGQVLNALAIQGDYQTPWMGNDGRFKMIRTINPDETEPTLDLDRGARVVRDSITNTSTLLVAPNRFIVISNSGAAQDSPIVGRYDVPPSAPNSIASIGFARPHVASLQVDTQGQADAAARNLGLQNTITRTVQLSTSPDPRHDGYDVVRWQGQNWLELAWSLPLAEGAEMTHTLRRSFV
jgi:hypothetical protein